MEERRIEAVIFDWAGTTVDFGSFAPVRAFISAFEKFEITPTVEEVRKPMGMLKKEHIRTMMNMERIHNEWIHIWDRDFTEEDIEQIYECSERGIMDILEAYTDIKPYVLETIKELREEGIKIGSTTGYTDEMMAVVASKAREQGYEPDYWCSPNAVDNLGRPYPYMIFRNMQELKVTSVHNVVKIGDTVADIKEALAAGVTAIGVIEGSSIMALSQAEYEALSDEEKDAQCQRVQAVYKACGADYVIRNLSELPQLLKWLC